ncbi:MAG TPA: DUF2171 domain-containing protein [Thermomicrobiales bacterium]|nr:DUF2171 domain-containing protein [Thermomicrobiales bacterium]
MSETHEWMLADGMDVIGADGEKLGEVQEARGDYFIAGKGWLFSTEFYIPATAIVSADEQAVYLNVTKEQALGQGWDRPMQSATIINEGVYETFERPASGHDHTPGGASPQAVAGDPRS